MSEELQPLMQPKVYRGDQGEKMIMVYLEPANLKRVLIQFENFPEGEWNGKVIMHEKKGNSDKEFFQSQEMSRPTIVIQFGSIQVLPRGAKKDIIMRYFDSKEAEALHPYEIINAYKNTTNATPPNAAN